MDAILFAPMEEQFGTYWQRETSRESDLWYKMLYCLQFRLMRKKIESFEDDPAAHGKEIDLLYSRSEKLKRIRYFYQKARVVLKKYRLSLLG